jgi:hypothetical protein
MKLLLSDYVGSLKERGELDAILPDLLSELGFHVISRPAIGAVQRGVDIAAVRRDQDGERKLFLFSVKAGDLTRAEWDAGVRATRARASRLIQSAFGSCATRRKAEAGEPVRSRINLGTIANHHCNQCKNFCCRLR